jgi:hypothetical protein
MNRIFKMRIQSHDKNNIMGIDEYLKMVGKEEGLAQGKEEQNRLFVGNLLKEGFAPEKIASLANVTIDFVKKVKND